MADNSAEVPPAKEVIEDVHALLGTGVSLERLLRIRPYDLSVKQLSDIAKDWLAKGKGVSSDQGQGFSLDIAKEVLSRSTSAMKSPEFCERMLDALEEDVPEDLSDPVTYCIMTDPVVLSSGCVVDRSTAFGGGSRLRLHKCPFTNEVLKPDVYPLLFLRRRLVDFAKKRIEHVFTVARTAMGQGHDGVVDLATALKAVNLGCKFLHEVGRNTYVSEAQELSELKLSILDKKQERNVKVWVEAYREAVGIVTLAGAATLDERMAAVVARAEEHFLGCASCCSYPPSLDATMAKAWLQGLCEALVGLRGARLSGSGLRRLAELLLASAKAAAAEQDAAQARTALFLAMQKAGAGAEEVERYLAAEGVRRADLEELLRPKEADFHAADINDTHNTDDYVRLLNVPLTGEALTGITISCDWADQGWGNKKGRLRARLVRPTPSRLDGLWRVSWTNGDSVEMQVLNGRFAVYGCEYMLRFDQGQPFFTWPEAAGRDANGDPVRQEVASETETTLTWRTTCPDESMREITWTRGPPVPPRPQVRRGAQNRVYCGRRLPYHRGSRGWCVARGRCSCDGRCGPSNGDQCAECYFETFAYDDAVVSMDLFGVYGEPERRGITAVTRTLDAECELLRDAAAGDILSFEYSVGGGGGHSLRVCNFKVNLLRPAVQSDNEPAGVPVAVPPDWLQPHLGMTPEVEAAADESGDSESEDDIAGLNLFGSGSESDD